MSPTVKLLPRPLNPPRRHDQYNQARIYASLLLLGSPPWSSSRSPRYVGYRRPDRSSLTYIDNSSDAASGVIRLYDGRGGDTPLETIETLHRFPVHVMTVCILYHLRHLH